MECERLENGMFFGIGEKNYPGWTWTVDTRVTDTPFMLEFLANLKNEAYIKYI